jgi:hypothetical protein
MTIAFDLGQSICQVEIERQLRTDSPVCGKRKEYARLAFPITPM